MNDIHRIFARLMLLHDAQRLTVVTLAHGVLRHMFLKGAAALAVVSLAVCLIAVATIAVVQQLNASPDDPAPPVAAKDDARQEPSKKATPVPDELPAKVDLNEVPKGAIARMGETAFRVGPGQQIMRRDGRQLFIACEYRINVVDVESGRIIRSLPRPGDVGDFLVAVSPDGHTLLCSDSASPYLLDVKTGRRTKTFDAPRCWSGTFTPDGKHLLVDHEALNERKGFRKIDIATGRSELHLKETRFPPEFAFSPNGRFFLANINPLGRGEQGILLVDFETMKVLRTLHEEGTLSFNVALSTDGRTVAIADARRGATPESEWILGLRFVDLPSKTERRVAASEIANLTFQIAPGSIDFSADGASLLVWEGSGRCRVIDVATGRMSNRFEIPPGRWYRGPEGTRIFGFYHIARVFDFMTREEINPPDPPFKELWNLKFSPDGKYVLGFGQHEPICCWEVATGRRISTLDPDGRCPTAYFAEFTQTRDGRLVTGGDDGIVRIWDVQSGKELDRISVIEPDAVRNQITIGYLELADDGKAAIVRASKSARDQEIEPVAEWFSIDLASKKVTPKNGTARPAGSTTWQESTAIVKGPTENESVQQGSQGDVFLKDRFNPDRSVKLHRVPQPRGENVGVPDFIEYRTQMTKVAMSGDGKLVALASCRLRKMLPSNRHRHENYHILVFDLPSGKERFRVPVEGWHPRSIKVSKDGRRLASDSGRSAIIWDVTTGKTLWTMPDVGHQVTALEFSPDGNRLATALDNTNIILWDVSETKRRR